jgi:hypothetical protein
MSIGEGRKLLNMETDERKVNVELDVCKSNVVQISHVRLAGVRGLERRHHMNTCH